ncbi:hypothetical protein [Haloquadratum walsbyi]|jgi:hypothetical protein|uniref:Uncharacterized protein n=1 Tax=Haloquadratum walsbyi J07HQW2 TaxID=1238425 RepID=U1PJ28_9EURY|nr:hypothetical protein [Haloquadratum walsbyi]ERG93672.1 MAG: hypothetical protein J07HQW2_00105 [Haloquadratum walsbyi J07HQW2]
MKKPSKITTDELAADVLNILDFNPMKSDVVGKIMQLQETGISDEKVVKTTIGYFESRRRKADNNKLSDPKPDELRVISMPPAYQRDSWE